MPCLSIHRPYKTVQLAVTVLTAISNTSIKVSLRHRHMLTRYHFSKVTWNKGAKRKSRNRERWVGNGGSGLFSIDESWSKWPWVHSRWPCCITMASGIRGQRVHGCMILCCHQRQLLGCSHNHTLWRLSYPYLCSPSTHLVACALLSSSTHLERNTCIPPCPRSKRESC